VSAGANHSLAVTRGGAVVAWGDDSSGELDVPLGLSNVVSVAGGEWFSLALKGDGTVVAWGDDTYGQINVPPGLSNVIAIAAGDSYSLALRNDGTLVAWGDNSLAQTAVVGQRSGITAISGQWNAVGAAEVLSVTSNGNIMKVGGLSDDYDHTYPLPYPQPDLTNAVAVARGLHSLALTRDGSVVAWDGFDDYGEIDVPGSLSNSVAAIAAGTYHSLALTSNGVVVGWGDGHWGETTAPPGRFVAIAAGEAHSIGLTTNGTVQAWGYNAFGQTNVPSDLSNVVAIASGPNYGLAVRKDGTVTGWGNDFDNNLLPPPGLSNVISVAGGGDHILALKNDGTITAWGDDYNFSGETDVPAGLRNVIAIAVSGDSHYGSVSFAVVAEPELKISQPTPQTIAVSWPTWSGDAALEHNTNLLAGSWLAVTNIPATSNGIFFVTWTNAQTSTFFRLRQ
jgi:alpha-tubulin suppressor-like RCC1 family protein